MSVLSALERELVAVEGELLDLLMIALPVCAKNGTLLFFNSQNLPDEYQHHWLPAGRISYLSLPHAVLVFAVSSGNLAHRRSHNFFWTRVLRVPI